MEMFQARYWRIYKGRDLALVKQGPFTILAWRDDYLRRVGINFAVNKHNLTIREPLWFAWLRFNLPCRLQHAKTWLNPLPVYYVVDSTDCDHVHATSAHKAPNGRTFLKEHEDVHNGAEGPTYVSVCTKAEYDAFEPVWRDYNLEAFENGHPHSPRR